MSLRINEEISGTFVDLLIEHQVNAFLGGSGEGKSFLFSTLLPYYCYDRGISLHIVDYKVMLEPVDIAAACSAADIVCLDNADLYLTREILEKIKKTAKYILISIKSPYHICTDAYACNIRYDDKGLKVR
jgi:hypothetical protein